MTNLTKERAETAHALPKKYFSKFTKSLAPIPDLVKDQTDSFKWLIEKGIKEVIDEFASIEDFSGKKFKFEFATDLSQLKNKNVLLVDDVVFSGKTLKEVTKLIKQAGVKKVIGPSLVGK